MMKFNMVLLILLGPSLCMGQGYRMESDRIIVEGEDWKAWDYPKGVLEFDEEDMLHPRFVRKNINACLDASEFGGGLWEAGSNSSDVTNVMDGEISTFWEPDKDAPLEDWWFEMDLGRAVSATKVVLKFVEEDLGEPFLWFKVGVSNGYKGEGVQPLYYRIVGKTTEPNESQRVFEIALSLPVVSSVEERFPGDVVRFVRIQVTGTKGDKREEISKEKYEALHPDWRGAVAYYRITEVGEERLITKEIYGELPPERQGPVKYYRRELPRLAEVEVWSLGENLSLGILDREGGIKALYATGSTQPIDGFDGDLKTMQSISRHTLRSEPAWIVVDLGAWFWVDTVRLILDQPWTIGYGLPGSTTYGGYRLNVSDGTRASAEELSWTTVSPESAWENMVEEASLGIMRYPYPVRAQSFRTPALYYLEDTFGPLKVRFLKLEGNPLDWQIIRLSEAQIFGEGYAPEIPLTSEIIEVGKGKGLTSVEWVSDTPPSTSVAVQTRTGDTVGEKKHYFDASGSEVSEYQWRYKLPGFMKGPVKTEPIVGPDWSPWSRPYEHSGDRFQSPSPKKYLQLRVKLLSDDPYQAPSLKSLSIPFTVPLTEAITGTRSPKEVQRLGAPEVFTIKIHPVLQEWHPGFNQLLVQTLDMMEMELVKLEVRRGVIESRPYTDWTDQVEILPTHPDTLWMVLPDTIQAGDTDEITLQFLSALYRDGTVFNVFVGNTALPGVWQQVESEDFHAYSKTFMVFVPLDKKMIDNVELVPRVITPNGDGINDVLTVHFTVGRIKAERPVRLTIYDMWGSKVRHIVERRPKYPMGKYAMEWDGRDEQGRLVLPGGYLVAIRVHSNWDEAKNTEIWRKVYVVY